MKLKFLIKCIDDESKIRKNVIRYLVYISFCWNCFKVLDYIFLKIFVLVIGINF